jgi:hypothetical protein
MILKVPTVDRQEERWVPVLGLEGRYEVSSWGSVRSLDRIQEYRNRSIKGRVLSQRLHKDGRLYVHLSTPLKRLLQVHRLVAQAFIPNTENKPEVNHLTGIPTCNYFEDLEWATGLENKHHAVRTGLYSKVSSQYYGVISFYVGEYLYWRANVREGDRVKNIGTFKTELEAAYAYEDYISYHNLPSLHNTNLPKKD